MRLLPLLSALSLAACVTPALSGDEISGVDWHLVGLEGLPVTFSAVMTFDGDQVGGKAPCNSWGGKNQTVLPAIRLGPIRVTRMACPDLAAEAAFFEALQAMQRAELDQGHLYLTGPEGRLMEFARDPAQPCLSCLARQ
jgi:heat shock protein HslJ